MPRNGYCPGGGVGTGATRLRDLPRAGKLVRSYRFLDPNRIELSVVADAQVVTNGLVLVWQRVQ